jgi:hypothetical protein
MSRQPLLLHLLSNQRVSNCILYLGAGQGRFSPTSSTHSKIRMRRAKKLGSKIDLRHLDTVMEKAKKKRSLSL